MSAKIPVIHLNVTEPKDAYHVDLLKFLFKNSAKYQLEPNSGPVVESRQEVELQTGALSIAAFAAGSRIEDILMPIRIPILKGLLGHRLLIIRDGEQARFSKIRNFDDLVRFKAGQGQMWSDTQILLSAGIPTVSELKYNNLFYMLEGSRFDYFPRGIHEPFSEIASRRELNLAVEPEIMLVYPLPLYLFVGKQNAELGRDTERMLEATIADGSFDEFFFNHPLIKDVLQKANIKQRRIIRIDNPHLTAQTPLDRKELWFDVNTL
ncbi:diguanylate cyclase [Algibacillus agarilyticus]|uniref:diguanylate cyclase n=1 Tax=Algibacillus agarilyticus TaxID=2234133 RepID=UPI0013004492|nr:diguanylate cyclase [Algibacillus agarilyticus]